MLESNQIAEVPKTIKHIIKITIAIALIGLLYYQLTIVNDIPKAFQEYQWVFATRDYFFILLVFVLLPINLLLESAKWRWVVNKQTKINYWEALRSVIVGITFGVITPNRVGEYYGRVLYFDSKKSKTQSLSATFISSIAQNTVTVIVGLFAVLALGRKQYKFDMDINEPWIITAILIAGIGYFLMPRLLSVALRFKKVLVQNLISFTRNWNLSDQAFVLLLAIGRYFTYLFQYALLLFLLSEVSLLDAALGVSIVYLIQSGIPLPAGISILARSNIALYIFSQFEVDAIEVLLATWGIWVINLMIPAFFGLYLLKSERIYIGSEESH